MKQFSKIIAALVIALALASATSPALAQYQPGEEVNQIVVDKKIKGLSESVWKDNYPSDFTVFPPNTQFEFQITVKNTGNRNLTWIDVRDSMPASLVYLFGREGTTVSGQLINWKIAEIKPGEEQTTVIRVQTRAAAYLPSYLKEHVNKVCVKAESGASDCDEARFFTNKGTQTNQQLPKTGSNNLVSTISLTISALSAGLAAYFYKKYQA
jgi:uncharacterized repeat protein (TIGR01451 family)/LPXTG-motif cell wall-anchored protein